MARMQKIPFKRGDTFDMALTWVEPDGTTPKDLTGVTIKSEVRAGVFTDELTVTVTDAAAGEFSLTRAFADTEDWPLTQPTVGAALPAQMFCDVQFTEAGVRVSSDTFEIIVLEDITDAA